MNEVDIWRSAKLLINIHGQRAESYASARIEAMSTGGDPRGEAVWRRVLSAIEDLQRQLPKSPSVH
jgi:hypothetical protein